jgi:hypothetical protein
LERPLTSFITGWTLPARISGFSVAFSETAVPAVPAVVGFGALSEAEFASLKHFLVRIIPP